MNQFLEIWKRVGLTALLWSSFVSLALGQVVVEDMEESSGVIYRMRLTPAAAPVPSFKYRFSVLPHETIAANAATQYLRSLGEKSLSAPLDNAYEKYGDAFSDWQSNSGVAIEDLLQTPAKEVSKQFDSYIHNYIARATRCRSCDWGYGAEDIRGPDVIEFMLPSVQETRSISRVVALQTRVAIAEKRFDATVDLMRMNYQLAANVNKMNFLVSSLVAFAEVNITNGTMIDLIATPGSPNMYWALTELPRPFIDFREAFRTDVTMVHRILPQLFEAEETDRSIEEWKRLTAEIAKSLTNTQQAIDSSMGEDVATNRNGLDSQITPKQLAIELGPTVISLLSYSNAKQQLIEEGEDVRRVESMPVAQTTMIAMARNVNKLAQDTERWIYLPADEALVGLKKQEELLMQAERSFLTQPGGIIASRLLPAGQQIYGAQVRVQRDIDAMRVIEAIRMHAAQTGELPETLDDISVVPVPLNPATNKPFEYQLKDGTATLELPRSDGITYSKRFELRL